MEFHQSQKIVVSDDHTYRVVCCGRQWGKTTLAVWEMLAVAYSGKDKKVAYFATTFDQARNIAWSILKEATRNVWAKAPNESRLELTIKTQDGGTSDLSLRGFENVETARGQQFDFLVIDEIASVRNWEYAWEAILEPTLAFRRGKALFISTPKGFNHFYDLYVKGQEKDSDYKSWRFKSDDNPYLPKESIEKARQNNTPDYFAQEYEADFRKYTGLVYKEFNREVNVIDPFPIPDSWSILAGMDFGSTNPTAYLWVAVDGDDNWFVFGEHYDTGKTIEYHAGVINSFPRRAERTFGDPSGAQWISEFRERGVYITPANKETGTSQQNWVRYGIEKIQEKLRALPGHDVYIDGHTFHNRPSLFVFKTCENLIKEFELYRWKEKLVGQATDLNEPDQPEKANDHALDALRYFAVSYKKVVELPDNFNVDQKDWSFK